MELWYTTTSPFARKVRVAAAELGLADRLALVRVDPWTDPRLRALNPLAKVPTLVRDDGGVLFESAVICEWLDSLGDRPRLFPPSGPDRWRALLIQGLADGAMTAAGRLFAAERSPAAERSDRMMARFAEARDAVLDRLEREELEDRPGIGEIAAASLLGYLDFRWPDRDWRGPRPRLAAWFRHFGARASMIGSVHHP